MTEISGGELLARCLASENVRLLFGLPCPEIDPLLAALEGHAIRFVPVRHEAAAVHMAEGVYKTTGHVAAVVGNPDVCNVFTMHKIFSPQEEVDMINTECRKAGIGCVDCKLRFAANLNKHLEPFRAKRAEFESKPAEVQDFLNDGGKRARAIAQETMSEVREAMKLP